MIQGVRGITQSLDVPFGRSCLLGLASNALEAPVSPDEYVQLDTVIKRAVLHLMKVHYHVLSWVASCDDSGACGPCSPDSSLV